MRLIDLLDPPPPINRNPQPDPLEITPGHVYHDGRVGFREVLAVCLERKVVRHRILSAKSEQAWCPQSLCANPVIGTVSEVPLAQFKRWAQSKHSLEEGYQMAQATRIARISLTDSERDLLEQVSSTDIAAALLNRRKAVALRNLRLKRLADHSDPPRLTELGRAWLQQQSAR